MREVALAKPWIHTDTTRGGMDSELMLARRWSETLFWLVLVSTSRKYWASSNPVLSRKILLLISEFIMSAAGAKEGLCNS